MSTAPRETLTARRWLRVVLSHRATQVGSYIALVWFYDLSFGLIDTAKLQSSILPTRSPPGEGPNLHALLPAAAAAGYLSVPTGAEFIKALMRGTLPAIWANAAKPRGLVVQKNFAAPGEG